MRDIHLSRELLRAIARGEVEPRILVRIGLEHLRCLCPTCAAEWDAWEVERQLAAEDRSGRRLRDFLAEGLQKVSAAEAAAAEDFRRLLKVEPARRVARIVRSPRRYRSAALVRLLIAEARLSVHSEPQRAYHFAELAFHVADRLSGSEMTQGLVPLALAEMANALRIQSNGRKARELFDRSRALTELSQLADPSVIARIDHLEAGLNMNLRLFGESERLLDRAKVLYGLVGASGEIARVEITRSLMLLEAGRPLEALGAIRKILKIEAVRKDPKLFLGTRINLARALIETKDLAAAKKVLDQDEPRQALVGEPLAHLRYPWMRGKIAHAERDFESAHAHFTFVRDGFLDAGAMYDAALVSLDLALSSLQMGRAKLVRQLAEEMLPIFSSQAIHREVIAALSMFQEAARQEVLTEALVRDLSDYLQAARYQPEIRFQPGAGAGN